jgi:predicted murein hydrolase (TIGR00659 family)
MPDFILGSDFFYVAITLAAFGIGFLIQKKWKLAIFNPLLIATILIMAFLLLTGIPNEQYQEGCEVLSWLLTPATICLAISFYQQFQQLKKHMVVICVGVIAGTICSLGSVYLLCQAFGVDSAITASLLPKSVTTAIGRDLSIELGGIAAITTAVIVVTGILGNIIGPALCKLLKLDDPIAQGVALGTSAHVIGTARAAQMSQLAGAVSSFSLTFAGLVTSILLSCVAQFL